MSRNEGRDVVDAERKTTTWRIRGIKIATIKVIAIASGVGASREDNQLLE